MKTSVDWKGLPGAFATKRRLKLEAEEEGYFKCPVDTCEHDGFQSQRGCRKHIATKHGWFYFFDKRPNLPADKVKAIGDFKKRPRSLTYSLPSFPKDSDFGTTLKAWLISPPGGKKPGTVADQVVSRALKYLRFCCVDIEIDELDNGTVNFCLGSRQHFVEFTDFLEKEVSVGITGRIGYVNAILELMDFQKFKGVPPGTLQSFVAAEIYVKRSRKCFAKELKAHWTTELDIDSLEKQNSWATMDELQSVIPFHLDSYKSVLRRCKATPDCISQTELSFATRFIIGLLFLQIKGTRPMTYQYLTLAMADSANSNNGLVDQRKFKTADKYGFDSVLFDGVSLAILNDYIMHVRPLLRPQSDFVLVNRNGQQFQKLTGQFSKLIYDAIGKYIHPTRYRQIIETTSVQVLDKDEQESISEDQKHSSKVAQFHYQKKRSRDVATKGSSCMKKLRGESGAAVERSLKSITDDIQVSTISAINEKNDTTSTKITSKICEILPVGNKERRTVLSFTKEEDKFLMKGLRKHGQRWESILKDPSLRFIRGRTAVALRKRSESKAFLNCCREHL